MRAVAYDLTMQQGAHWPVTLNFKQAVGGPAFSLAGCVLSLQIRTNPGDANPVLTLASDASDPNKRITINGPAGQASWDTPVSVINTMTQPAGRPLQTLPDGSHGYWLGSYGLWVTATGGQPEKWMTGNVWFIPA